jgi:hypothetical protein
MEETAEAKIVKQAAMRDALLEHLSYNPDTGEFTRLKNSGPRKAGSRVGVVNGRYVQIGFGGYRDRAHRLAWLFVHGYIPEEIDHINGNGLDNRMCNLRSVTHQQNNQNHVKPPKHNSTGFMGVSFFKGTNRFYSYIQVNGKKMHLGYFDTPDEAHQVYLQAKRKYHSSCTI